MGSQLTPWLLLAALLLGAWALFNVYRARTWLAAIEEELDKLSVPQPGEDVEAPVEGAPTLECVIRVRDPLAVAKQESQLAWTVTGIAPHLITREVYRQVREESQALLAERRIDADVRIRVC